MANRGSAFGFSPVGTTDGADYHGKMREIILDDGAAAYMGDMLILSGTILATDKVERMAPAATGAAGNTLVGALTEVYPDFTDEGSLITNYHPAGSDGSGRICYGTDVIFAAREDAVADVISGLEVGGSVDLVTGTPALDVSAMALDSDTAAANLTQALKIVRLGEQVSNEFAAAAGDVGAVFHVTINPVA